MLYTVLKNLIKCVTINVTRAKKSHEVKQKRTKVIKVKNYKKYKKYKRITRQTKVTKVKRFEDVVIFLLYI